MKLSRNFTTKIRYLLDQCLPPFVRDWRWVMSPLIRIVYGDATPVILSFKERAPFLTDAEYKRAYEQVRPYDIERETDCNDATVIEIVKNAVGPKVLEVACGRAYLADKIARNTGFSVTGTDIVIEQRIRERYPNINFVDAFVERLPFENGAFDTVICTHCIEHVMNIGICMAELRRVARRRLIVVVPKQRPYKYSFDLHVNFFPYIHSFLMAVIPGKNPPSPGNVKCYLCDGDIYYQEEMPVP